MKNDHEIGCIVGGSLSDGFIARLNVGVDQDGVAVGRFVCMRVDGRLYFYLVTNLSLETSGAEVAANPPGHDEMLFAQIVAQRDVYIRAHLKPMLALDPDGKQVPIKSIPRHFTPIFKASPDEIARVFGSEGGAGHYFGIGSPLGMKGSVCLDLDKFVERSNGIFGKTGTGKTFITRTILAGLAKTGAGVNLVFDMHSEYGIQARSEGKGLQFVKGLKTLFGNKVAIFSLDPEATRRRGCSPDVAVELSYRDVRVHDVLLLQDELVLHSTALEAAHLLGARFGRDWLSALLERGQDLKELSEMTGAHPESLGALYRKLKRLEHFPFLKKNVEGPSVIDTLVQYLDRGIHVILEFGRQTSMLCYLLIAGIITRRIHRAYIAKTERYLATHQPLDEPKKLVITIEEAHKFLNPRAAKQTIFGLIAREMRKYYVSLLVVDQRPSCIDDEVISQLGTKIIAQLDDDRDMQSVLTGAGNNAGSRAILSTLGSKKQAFVIGHAIPMPVVIQTREYDEKFYACVSGTDKPLSMDESIKEIFT